MTSGLTPGTVNDTVTFSGSEAPDVLKAELDIILGLCLAPWASWLWQDCCFYNYQVAIQGV